MYVFMECRIVNILNAFIPLLDLPAQVQHREVWTLYFTVPALQKSSQDTKIQSPAMDDLYPTNMKDNTRKENDTFSTGSLL